MADAQIRRRIGARDFTARLGDETFLVVTPELDPASAQVLAVRILHDVTTHFLGQAEVRDISILVAEGYGFIARAVLSTGVMDDDAIRGEELTRAQHALAYLKGKIGNARMRELLAEDTARTKAQARTWVEQSAGRWRTDQVELVVSGPTAKDFHRWYEQAMAEKREAVLRAGHPEHFMLHPEDDGIEVIENIGETDLPWRVVYRALPEDAFPLPWDGGYPTRFGAELVDSDGLRLGFTMHESRDCDDGMHLLLRTVLPEAAPSWLVQRHLHHFVIEFRNWTEVAWREAQGEGQT